MAAAQSSILTSSNDPSSTSLEPVKLEPRRAAAAYAALEGEISAVSPERVVRVNLDIPRAAAIAVGAVPTMAVVRPQMAALPGFDIAMFDKLEQYALAAFYAHLLAMPPSTAGSPVGPMIEEAVPLRHSMGVAADALVHFGMLDAAKVAEIDNGTGHIDLASDLVSLSAVFTARWDELEHKTALTREAVDRAGVLGTELLVALGARLQPQGEPLRGDGGSERRARAFTLFMNAYDACRRAVTFLRWNEGDADLIAPSLFTKTRRKASEPTSEEVPTLEGPPVPTSPQPA